MNHLQSLALGLFCLIPTLLSAQGYPTPDPALDVLHYQFQVQITDESDEIQGDATWTLVWKDSTRETFAADLIGPREAYPGYGMAVSLVTLDGDTLDFVQRDLELELPAPAGRTVGDTARLRIVYAGRPADGLIISANAYGERTFFGDNWPVRARYWLPVIDHPADKATCEWRVIAPSHYQVVANGTLRETTDLPAGNRLHRYRCETPLAPKIMVFAAARFAVAELGRAGQVPVSAWVYPQARDEGFYDYQLATPILAFFDSLVGPYPFGKLANVQSTTRFGGMENASCIFYDERSVTGTRSSETLIAHEIAHQWFGNHATEADWPHLWLSEGFATYFEALWLEHAYGEERLQEDMANNRRTIFRAAPNEPLVPEVEDPMSLLNANSYQKGSWVLHMLRQQVGDEAFFAGLRAYYAQYAGKNATTDDFRQVMEQVSEQDLSEFFELWVHTAGQPPMRGSWHYADSTLTVEVRQLQPAGQRLRLPVEIGVQLPGEAELRFFTINSDRRTVEASFSLPQAPEQVLWDPRVKLLVQGNMVQE